MSDRLSTLQETINLAVEKGIRNLYTCIPAKVVKWDSSTQRANCQILVKETSEDEEGNRTVESNPVVPGVPVQFFGAGNYRITCPISDGSTGDATIGLLLFSHRSLDKWLSGTGKEVDPEFDHDHSMADAVFIPGLKPFGAPWDDVPSSGMSIGKDGGLQGTFTDDLIVFAATSGNAKFVALENLVNDTLTTLKSAINTGKSSVVPNDGGLAAFTALYSALSSWPASVAASKVKAE